MWTTLLLILLFYVLFFHYFSRELFQAKDTQSESMRDLALRVKQLEDGLRRIEKDLKDK